MSIALPKGRLMDNTMKYLKEAGIDLDLKKNRELVQSVDGNKVVLSKPSDVPVYVEHGIDIGIAGSDVLEERKSDVFVPIELDFGRCRLSVAVPEEKDVSVEDFEGYTIATEYPNLTSEYFEEMNISIKIVGLDGSVEVAPRISIADAIVDIVETGRTLKANDLVEIEKIMDVSALFMVNRISQKVRFEEINELVEKLKEV
ncbi:MAG: ATP phosphoribosyltransferase [Candidatus Thermoplasmatota archaeon]|nr:ATP phosphoribosyltransferase [Candidatus Thermoplasmatota archaeon]